MSRTQLSIKNSSDSPVEVFLTLNTVAGSISNVNAIPFISRIISNSQGAFMLDNGQTVTYITPLGVGLSGNISFGEAPNDCPTKRFPSGINLAEFSLNTSFGSGPLNESISINCVAGTNALIFYEMSGGGTWNAGATYPLVTHFFNRSIGNNVGAVGVFPFQCETCNDNSKPLCINVPLNAPVPPVPQSEKICEVQRSAYSAGGEVLIHFADFA
ncbi:MAG: hypothetical protein HEP71_08150 [Roseivirga sp.]|nr:hypothetical protein [Roseivirga sp.]